MSASNGLNASVVYLIEEKKLPLPWFYSFQSLRASGII